jgi:hypothetical protein
MTLIMAAITRSYAIVASDRRITRRERDATGVFKKTSFDDSDTKTIMLDRRYLMGFAGLGRVQVPGQTKGKRLEQWMAEDALAEAPREGHDYFDVLARKSGPLCEEQNHLEPHIYIAAGWQNENKRGATDAELVVVQNSRRFRHEFTVTRRPLGNEDFLFKSAGPPT